MINKLIQELCKITKEINGIVSKEMILKNLLLSSNVSNYKFIVKNREEENFSIDYNNEKFLFLDTFNEKMNPLKQDYYFQYIDKRSYENNIPFLFIYNKKMFLIVINQNSKLQEAYMTKQNLELPNSYYVVNNGTTFVDFNNFDKIEFRLVSEKPDHKDIDDRNFKIEQVEALNIFNQYKFELF